MDCPKCVGILEKKKVEGIEVDVCPICEGMWFDAGELEDVIRVDSKDFDYIDVGREELDGKELTAANIDLNSRKGKCPKCSDGTILLQKQYEKKHTVRIDMCPKGHGLWLDGGEIESLRKRGVVRLKERLDLLLGIIKYAFSKDGFRNLMRRSGR